MPSRPASTNVPAARSGPRGNRRRAGAAIIAVLAVLGGAAARPMLHIRSLTSVFVVLSPCIITLPINIVA